MRRRTLVCAVGDVFIDEDGPDPGHSLAPIAPLLRRADILIGNCEGAYSDRDEQSPSAGIPLRASPRNAAALSSAGFRVMSLANNHSVDAGHGGLRDTIAALHDQGIEAVGAGGSLDAAREPVLVEHDGHRVAFLACASYFPFGYEARPGVPGIAPLRFHNHYSPSAMEVFHCPGALPDVLVLPHEGDRALLLEAIRGAAADADVVVVMFHWGESMLPTKVAGFERETARLAIDAGADIVLGTHHHIVRGVDVYRGATIFHGLGHFVFHVRGWCERATEEVLRAMRERWGEYGLLPRDDYPLLPMHPDARITMIAACEIVDGDVAATGVLPCFIDPDGSVRPLPLDGDEGRRAAAFLQRATAEAELGVTLELDGGIEIAGHRLLRISGA